MTPQLPQVVAELIQAVGVGGEFESSEYGLVNLFGRPAADSGATMQEYFHQADDPWFMDLDSGITDGANGHRQCQSLQQREIHMDVEPLGLAIGETIGNDLESLPHDIQMIETLLQSEVAQIVGNQFVAQEPGELFILLEEGVFPVGSEDMMTVLDLLDDGAELAAELLAQAHAEDLADFVRGQTPQPQLTGTFENFVNGKVAFENEVAAVLDLVDRRKSATGSLPRVLSGKTWDPGSGSVVQLLADHFRAEPVGCAL